MKKNFAKVFSLLLAMFLLVSVPATAQAACSHSYQLAYSSYTSDKSTHTGPNGPCTITSYYRVDAYYCRFNCGSTKTTYNLTSTSHSVCK